MTWESVGPFLALTAGIAGILLATVAITWILAALMDRFL